MPSMQHGGPFAEAHCLMQGDLPHDGLMGKHVSGMIEHSANNGLEGQRATRLTAQQGLARWRLQHRNSEPAATPSKHFKAH